MKEIVNFVVTVNIFLWFIIKISECGNLNQYIVLSCRFGKSKGCWNSLWKWYLDDVPFVNTFNMKIC